MIAIPVDTMGMVNEMLDNGVPHGQAFSSMQRRFNELVETYTDMTDAELLQIPGAVDVSTLTVPEYHKLVMPLVNDGKSVILVEDAE